MLFRCSIRGENFPGELIGKKGQVGFYTTRWVEAPSLDEAEKICLEHLRGDPSFQIKSQKLREQSTAKVYFEEIVAVESPKRKLVNSGATWFEM